MTEIVVIVEHVYDESRKQHIAAECVYQYISEGCSRRCPVMLAVNDIHRCKSRYLPENDQRNTVSCKYDAHYAARIYHRHTALISVLDAYSVYSVEDRYDAEHQHECPCQTVEVYELHLNIRCKLIRKTAVRCHLQECPRRSYRRDNTERLSEAPRKKHDKNTEQDHYDPRMQYSH